ncbi:hypothetical protein SCHPADRAFT_636266 [Schizopora paradoxa]|uniref:F-box domain-containing protein n=1 Tax=Schizopora paradoxa TaxID=27342 RepID=A0A0H2R7A6_9AGAM|nr:hypothetical protein SCHPADRAFT_636266 [Schizopora paradoxa]
MTEAGELCTNLKYMASSWAKLLKCLVDDVPVKTLGEFDTKLKSAEHPISDKMSLLLQHAERWTRFLFSATQPRFIHLVASMVRSNNHRLQLLTELSLHPVLTYASDFNLTGESLANQKTFWFDNAMPLLYKMALARCRFPDSISPNSIQAIFPTLVDLKMSQVDGRSFLSLPKLLDGLPQLRALTIIQTLCTREDTLQGLYRRPVVLGSLEELIVQESNGSTLEHIFNLISVPNVQSLALIKTGIYNAFPGAVENFSLLPNIRNLNLDGVWFENKDLWEGMTPSFQKLFSAMPKLTSIHLDSTLQDLAALLFRPSGLLPHLMEISLTGLSGDLIVNIVEGRQKLRLPVKTLHIDKGSILFGVVTSKHWEDVQRRVETLRWFDCGTKGDPESLKLFESTVQMAGNDCDDGG